MSFNQGIVGASGDVRLFECVHSPILGHLGNVDLVIGIWRERDVLNNLSS